MISRKHGCFDSNASTKIQVWKKKKKKLRTKSLGALIPNGVANKVEDKDAIEKAWSY